MYDIRYETSEFSFYSFANSLTNKEVDKMISILRF